jgi:hypothetical protein
MRLEANVEFVTTKKESKLCGAEKSFISFLWNERLLFCSAPSRVRGVSNKFSVEDTIRNYIVVHLINTGMKHKKAHSIVKNINEDADTTSSAQLFKHGTLLFDVDSIRNKILRGFAE